MNCENKIILVTGGAHGIGRALCRRFAAEKAKQIIVADVDFDNARKVADEIGGAAFALDVADETQVKNVVKKITEQFGEIDIVCSNAGITGDAGAIEVSNESWQRTWEINVLSHLYLSRAILPQMERRGDGYFLLTVSAAGLLTHFEVAPYSVTKHAALAFGEWLSIAYHDKGIRVSCLCPQGVKTRMIMGDDGQADNFLLAEAVTPEQVADDVIKGIADEKFLILPHAEVVDYFRNKAADYDRWLGGLRKMRRDVLTSRPTKF